MQRRARNPKTVVITGASAGVGRAAAEAFASGGADVALLARDAAALDDTAATVRRFGVRVLPVALDMSDADAVEAAAQRIEPELGPIDVWVNNAMVTVFSPVERVSAAEFARVTNVTYLGYVWGTMAALRHMKPRNRGSIVQVGSALAYRSIPLQSAYCGAKHGIRGFTDALRCELLHEHSRVRVSMVQMPAVNTPQPVPPIYQPEVAARAIRWAATHRCREMYVGFSSIKTIVANKIAPGLLDRYLGRTGYGAQQRPGAVPPRQRSNLREPVTRVHRMHGAFDREARDSSATLWMDTHRRLVLCAALGAAALAWRAVKRR